MSLPEGPMTLQLGSSLRAGYYPSNNGMLLSGAFLSFATLNAVIESRYLYSFRRDILDPQEVASLATIYATAVFCMLTFTIPPRKWLRIASVPIYGSFALVASYFCIMGFTTGRVVINYLVPLILAIFLMVAFILGPESKLATWLPYVTSPIIQPKPRT